jgi:hypothetical protein
MAVECRGQGAGTKKHGLVPIVIIYDDRVELLEAEVHLTRGPP